MSAFEVMSAHASQGIGADAAPEQGTANSGASASGSGAFGAAIVETHAGAGEAVAARAAKLPPHVRH